jgi:valyl-tRNA synthetase
LLSRCTGEQDIRFSEKMVADTRTFANKVWNISRFAGMHLDPGQHYPDPSESTLGQADRWILSRYARLERQVTEGLERFEFGAVSRALYDFLWGELADWYLEWIKTTLREEGPKKTAVQSALVYVLPNVMKLMHPIMPHLTEEVWQRLPHEGDSIMVSSWPAPRPDLLDPLAEAEMGLLIDTIKTIRSMKSDFGLAAQATSVVLLAEDVTAQKVLEAIHEIRMLSRSGEIVINGARPKHAAAGVVGPVEVLLPLAAEEAANASQRLRKELAVLEKDLAKIITKLANPDFVSRAPEDIVNTERTRQAEGEVRKAALERYLKSLNG